MLIRALSTACWVATILTNPHEPGWWERDEYIGVWIGTVLVAVSMIVGLAILWRQRPRYSLGPARFVRQTDAQVVYAIDFHIVATGHWVMAKRDVRFGMNGSPLTAEQHDATPDRGVGEMRGQFVYELDRQPVPIDVDAVLKLEHGRRMTYRGRLEPR